MAVNCPVCKKEMKHSHYFLYTDYDVYNCCNITYQTYVDEKEMFSSTDTSSMILYSNPPNYYRYFPTTGLMWVNGENKNYYLPNLDFSNLNRLKKKLALINIFM